jgi:DNA-directed RNA polymerase subunit E'|tara:strand:- start:1375 stop:1935 length:561 start_codon:yes stop_codon:yes gene_type:complete
MFYELKIKDHIRVAPTSFKEDVKESVLKSLNEKFEGYVSEELGFIIGIKDIDNIGEGLIIPGDGAAHYETTFTIFTFIPEMQEVVLGKISEITDFGAFMDIGPIDGMIHVSQTMDDYVSFSKENVLTGKESKKVLKSNDTCRARIIAVSYKEINNPKIGLTMRQALLGNLKWIEEELKNQKEKKNG